MNHRKRIRLLNQRFVKFGVNPFGEPIYQWMHTTDLHYLIQRGDATGEWLPTAGTKLLTRHWEPVYERHTWADTPHGMKWIMAKWQPPMPREDWERVLGHAMPWPSRGEYHPIENMGCHDGGCDCKNPQAEPDDAHTISAVAALEYHLGHTKQELMDRLMLRKHNEDKAVRNEIADDMWDTMTAWGRIPGSNDGTVSILNEAYRKAERKPNVNDSNRTDVADAG